MCGDVIEKTTENSDIIHEAEPPPDEQENGAPGGPAAKAAQPPSNFFCLWRLFWWGQERGREKKRWGLFSLTLQSILPSSRPQGQGAGWARLCSSCSLFYAQIHKRTCCSMRTYSTWG